MSFLCLSWQNARVKRGRVCGKKFHILARRRLWLIVKGAIVNARLWVSVRASAVVASLCFRVLEEGGLRGQETLELSGGRLLEECWKFFENETREQDFEKSKF